MINIIQKLKFLLIKKVHNVYRTPDCYFCINCGKASGDGDGLVGEKCKGYYDWKTRFDEKTKILKSRQMGITAIDKIN